MSILYRRQQPVFALPRLCLAIAMALSLIPWAVGQTGSEKLGSAKPQPAVQPESIPTEVVQIASGKIRGLQIGETRDVHAFKGIPFAKPPVGELRWREPVDPQPWDGVKDCFQFGNACPQVELAMMAAIPQMKTNAPLNEDCLYLNVWRPAELTNEKLPVMVWIHGGGYTLGAASQTIYDGQSLARKGVVLVSINYRLGPFGFLAHPALSKESPKGISGNYGILDMIQGLRWVRDNIAAFGGDPNRVTIFGESAGGGAVLCLMVAPEAAGLFHGAIAQSAPDSDFSRLKESVESRISGEAHGVKLLTEFGIGENATADQLRELEVDRLLKVFPSLSLDRKFDLNIQEARLPVGPLVDGVVIPDLPNRLFATGKAHSVPLIVGNTRDEMTMFLTQTPMPKEVDQYQEMVSRNFGPLSSEILAAYPATDARSIRKSVVDLLGDAVFATQARYAARAHSHNGYPTYRYVFSVGTRQFPLSALGAHHACELAFVFGQPAAPTADDWRVVETVQGYWVNFAKTGNPNGEGLPQWPSTNSASDVLVEFEKDVAIRETYRSHQLDTMDKYLDRPVVEATRVLSK